MDIGVWRMFSGAAWRGATLPFGIREFLEPQRFID